jgi:hypothetical protein
LVFQKQENLLTELTGQKLVCQALELLQGCLTGMVMTMRPLEQEIQLFEVAAGFLHT